MDITYQGCSLFDHLCQGLMGSLLTEGNPADLDPEAANIFLARAQYGIGIRVLQHLYQSVRTSDLTYFNHSPEENLEMYGTELPPQIPLENINVPIALMFAEFDTVITEPDRQWVRDRIDDNIIFDHNYEE